MSNVRQYVGARYVPKLANPVEWQSGTSYEALTIVTYNNASYTSRIPVPPTVGNPADNTDYWVITGNYNAQVEQYRQETNEVKGELGTVKNDLSSTNNNLTETNNKLNDEITRATNRENDLENKITYVNQSLPYYENSSKTLIFGVAKE